MDDGGRISYAWNKQDAMMTYRQQLLDLFRVYEAHGYSSEFRCSLADGVSTALLIDEAYGLVASQEANPV
jgi:hypothetical protein